MFKKIKFSPAFDFIDHVDINPPFSAKKNIPNWYKNMQNFIDKNHKDWISLNGFNLTAKKCIPIFDSISIGYVITLPCDVTFVKYNNDTIGWFHLLEKEIIQTHSYEQIEGFPIPENYGKDVFKFVGFWNIETPKGYSLLYTHPFYRFDLPFITLTGLVDSDKYSQKINLPFFLKKNFVGTIKKDTPIAQIIPIKRNNWISVKQKYKKSFNFENISLKNIDSYKKRFWQKKQYF